MIGSFSEKGLEAYKEAIQAHSGRVDFSESETYDFTRCVRPDGSAYGTGGKCRKGTETQAEKEEKPGRARRRSREDERTLAIVGQGGFIPRIANYTPEEEAKRAEETKKRVEVRKKMEGERRKEDERLTSLADKFARKESGPDNDTYRNNRINAYKGDLKDLSTFGSDKSREVIKRGDAKEIAKTAYEESRTPIKDRVKAAADKAKEEQKMKVKEMLATAPKEEKSRLREQLTFDAKKEVERAKYAAEKEGNAWFNLYMNTRNLK
jgi:hypothetical protein